MALVYTRPGAVLPFELRSLQLEGGDRVQHAYIVCCDCSTHTAQFPWIHPFNPTSIAEKFTRMGWELYKNKARCPDCKKARARQKQHFAQRDELKRREEAMKTQTTNASTGNLNPPINTNTQVRRPMEQPHHVPPPPAKEVVRVYLLTVNSDGTIETRDIEGSKEMLFGDQTYLVIPR
jgi:hypothetical protein